ncbi:General transcription factor IIIC, polypeptide 3, partial [Perkinsus olseni]
IDDLFGDKALIDFIVKGSYVCHLVGREQEAVEIIETVLHARRKRWSSSSGGETGTAAEGATQSADHAGGGGGSDHISRLEKTSFNLAIKARMRKVVFKYLRQKAVNNAHDKDYPTLSRTLSYLSKLMFYDIAAGDEESGFSMHSDEVKGKTTMRRGTKPDQLEFIDQRAWLIRQAIKYPQVYEYTLILGHLSTLAQTHRYSVREYYRAMRLRPNDPYPALLLTASLITMSISRVTYDRQLTITKGLAVFQLYEKLRLEQQGVSEVLAKAEIAYNQGRLWHQLSVFHLADRLYRQALTIIQKASRRDKVEDEVEYVRLAAAYNLATLHVQTVSRAISRTFPIVWLASMPVFYLNRRSACRREAAMERLKDSAESFNLMNVESLAPKLDAYSVVPCRYSQLFSLVREFDEATGVDAEREAARLLRRGMKMLEAEDIDGTMLLQCLDHGQSVGFAIDDYIEQFFLDDAATVPIACSPTRYLDISLQETFRECDFCIGGCIVGYLTEPPPPELNNPWLMGICGFHQVPRKELLRSVELLANVPAARKHFHSVEMEALHSMAVQDFRCDRVDFEFITRYSSACSTAGYINAALYAAIVDRLSQRAKVEEQGGSSHQPISHRNIITLLAIITTKQRSTVSSTSSPHREETRLFAALIGYLYRSPVRRLAAADAAVICQAVGEADDRRLIDIREWMKSDSYSLVTEAILPRMMSFPLPCFTVDDIVSILSGCALLPRVSRLSIKFLDHCLPRLLAESSTLEATQISLLRSIMHIYRDQWADVARGVARLDDADDFRQYLHMPHNLAAKLVQSLKARKHEPSELARIALGVARLCT